MDLTECILFTLVLLRQGCLRAFMGRKGVRRVSNSNPLWLDIPLQNSVAILTNAFCSRAHKGCSRTLPSCWRARGFPGAENTTRDNAHVGFGSVVARHVGPKSRLR